MDQIWAPRPRVSERVVQLFARNALRSDHRDGKALSAARTLSASPVSARRSMMESARASSSRPSALLPCATQCLPYPAHALESMSCFSKQCPYRLERFDHFVTSQAMLAGVLTRLSFASHCPGARRPGPRFPVADDPGLSSSTLWSPAVHKVSPPIVRFERREQRIAQRSPPLAVPRCREAQRCCLGLLSEPQ